MKSFITLLVISLICVTLFQPAVWAGREKKHIDVIEEQKKLINEYNEFLDSLEEYVRRYGTRDKRTTERVLETIEYARGCDVVEKMKVVVKLVSENNEFAAVKQCLRVDEDLEKIEQLMCGTGKASNSPEIIDRIIKEAEKVRREMDEIDVTLWDRRTVLREARDRIARAILDQEGLQGELRRIGTDGGMSPHEVQKNQVELEKTSCGIADYLDSAGVAGGAVDSMRAAAGKMSGASSALDKMDKSCGGSGEKPAKRDAAIFMSNAIERMKEAKNIIEKEDEKLREKIERKGYNLKKLIGREKDIAKKLNSLRKDAARATGSSSEASRSFGSAAAESRRAAQKMGEAARGSGSAPGAGSSGDGGESAAGAGGAFGPQGNARADVDSAIEDLRRRMEWEKAILALENVESSLKLMIKGQEEINETTRYADGERMAFEQKHPGRKYGLSRVLRHRIMSARGRESDLAFMAGRMAKILEKSNPVFSGVFGMMGGDMLVVAGKLEKLDVGEDTRSMQADILKNLKYLLKALGDELDSLENKRRREGKGDSSAGSGGKPRRSGQALPTLAEVKLLRTMQIEVMLQTSQLDEVHKRRIAAIDSDKNLSAAQKMRKRRIAGENKISLSKYFASRQSRIAALMAALIDKVKGGGK